MKKATFGGVPALTPRDCLIGVSGFAARKKTRKFDIPRALVCSTTYYQDSQDRRAFFINNLIEIIQFP
jgi:hypothetical protein